MLETEEFSINDNEIRLLRNRYCYQSIPLAEISQVEVYYGRKVKNGFFLVLIALVILGISLLLLLNIINLLLDNFTKFNQLEHREIRGLGVNLLLFSSLLFFGVFMLRSALQRTVVMKINHSILLSLEPFSKSGKLNRLLLFLKKKIPTNKLHISSSIKSQWKE